MDARFCDNDGMHKKSRLTGHTSVLAHSLVLSLALAMPWPVSAEFESMRFEHLTVNDGLSQSSINALLQDRRGYLWIGTQDGLNRFDGYRFDIMRNDPDDPRSLANNNISSIFEDSGGVLWVGTTSGTLHRFVPGSADFDRFLLPGFDAPNLGVTAPSGVREIVETSDGSFWIGTDRHGLYSFDRRSGQFVRAEAVVQASVNVLNEVSSGRLWVGTSTGLTQYSISAGVLVPLGAGNDRLLDEDIRSIEVLRSGEVWVAGGGGTISRLDANGSLLGRISTRSRGVAHEDANRSMLEDSNGRIWVGLIGGGVKVFSSDGELLATLAHSPRDPYTLNTNTAYTLMEDRAGVLWVGSLEAGLSKSLLGSGGFTHIRHIPGDPSSLSDNMVIEIAEDEDGGIWVGSSGGGLDFLQPGNSKLVHYRTDPDNPASLSSDRIWGLYLEPGGPLWVGTWGGGLNRLDRKSAKVRRYQPDGLPGSIPGAIVTTIVGDGNGGIYAGLADGGLVYLAAGRETFSRLTLFDSTVEQEQPVNIAALHYDRQGRLWVGTWSRGLCVAAVGSREFDCHTRDQHDKQSINDNNIRAFAEDESGTVWIATGNGIARYLESAGHFERFTVADGLMPGVVYGIVPEGNGVLWLSSNHGLMRFDTQVRAGRQYEYRDGLQANEFNGGAALKTRSGEIYFGGVGGITRFEPSRLVNNPLPPTVVITEFSLFNKPVPFRRGDATSLLKKPMSETTSLELDYDQNFIGFEFAGLHFVSPARNRYAYKLEGLDPDWTETDASRRFASYANLAPGDYVFRVRAANSDGVWSVADAVIDIHIAPPWWLTWWAKSLMVLLAAMLLLLFIQWRLSLLRVQTRQLAAEVEKRTAEVVAQKDTIERQAARLEDALESKSRFFARLSHEFRTPITLILGPIDESLRAGLPEKNRNLLALARRNGERLLQLVDQLLTLARHDGQQHVERLPTAVAPVVRLVVAEFDSAASQKGIALALDAVEDVWVSSNADALQTILINLLSNAIKYTDPGGRVAVTLRREGSSAVLKVADTGVGIAEQDLDTVFNLFERGAATGPGTGIGLTLVKELVDAHGGTIAIDSVPAAGTTVTVTLTAVAAVPDVPAVPLVPMDIDIDVFTREAPDPASSASAHADGEVPEVLVIDDNDDMRRFVVDLLSPEYRCIEARDGTAGLAAAVEGIPDAVICDVMMPGLDGFEVLERLRSDEHSSHIPIILLTARGDEASRLKGLKERADDYIAKPFNADELRYRLRNLIELNQLRAERARQQLLAGDAPAAQAGEMPGPSKRDRAFLDRLGRVLVQHFADAEFHPNDLADAMHMSHRQLQRKLKALFDIAPATYLRDFRLQRAKQQLEMGHSVTDAALASGFSSPGYFARCFSARYGTRPSDITAR